MTKALLLVGVSVFAVACGSAPTGPGNATPPVVMIFGDSIAEGVAIAAAGTINAGVPSERMSTILRDSSTSQMSGEQRIATMIAAHRPDTLVIFEGTNDVFEGVYRGGDDWLTFASEAMRSIIRQGRAGGVTKVFMSTVPPQRSGGVRNRDVYAAQVPRLNDRLRDVANSEAAVLVDSFALVSVGLDLFLSSDDVHLTSAGYENVWAHLRSLGVLQR